MTGPSMLSFNDQSGANVFNLARPQAITSASKNRTEAKRCRIKKSNSWKSSFFSSSLDQIQLPAREEMKWLPSLITMPLFCFPLSKWLIDGDKNRTDQKASNLRPFDWKRWKAASEKNVWFGIYLSSWPLAEWLSGLSLRPKLGIFIVG